MNSALVCSMIAPIRAEPSGRAQLTDEVLCGEKTEILEQRGEWCRIRTRYLYEGWTPGKNLSFDGNDLLEWESMPKRVVLQAHADVLESDQVKGVLVAELTRGALVCPVGQPCGGWQKVRLSRGREGWTWGAFLGKHIAAWETSNEEELRRALIQTALSYLGTQYRWGGKTPLGIDCSGLCSMSYLLNGVTICRDAHLEPEFCMHRISLSRMREGDLMFFPGHVAMYLGEGQYIHSTAGNGCHGVVINSLNPEAPDYRPDLPPKLLYAGSVF